MHVCITGLDIQNPNVMNFCSFWFFKYQFNEAQQLCEQFFAKIV